MVISEKNRVLHFLYLMNTGILRFTHWCTHWCTLHFLIKICFKYSQFWRNHRHQSRREFIIYCIVLMKLQTMKSIIILLGNSPVCERIAQRPICINNLWKDLKLKYIILIKWLLNQDFNHGPRREIATKCGPSLENLQTFKNQLELKITDYLTSEFIWKSITCFRSLSSMPNQTTEKIKLMVIGHLHTLNTCLAQE